MRAATKPDGEEYFEYVFIYVDDCLVILHNPEAILREEIGKNFNLKKESNPVDVAQYATARGIQEEPAFAWCGNHIPYARGM